MMSSGQVRTTLYIKRLFACFFISVNNPKMAVLNLKKVTLKPLHAGEIKELRPMVAKAVKVWISQLGINVTEALRKRKNERNEINFDVIHFANQKKYEAIREITD